MPISNTNILIKRSSSTGKPSLLQSGELGYSYVSNTLFFGTVGGNGVVNVGGQYYTSTIDAATDAATAGALAKRDATGNVSFNFVDAQLTRSTGVTPGQYGSNSAVPIITVSANGLISNVSTQQISTSFTAAGDSGSSVIPGGGTLTISGGAGLVTSESGGTITIDVDTSVLRTNTELIIQTIDSNVEIAGNLIVRGTQTITNTDTLNIADPLIYLGANNYASDLVDIGFVGNYFDGSVARHAGVFRHAANKEFYVFDNYTPEPSGNVINIADGSFRVANLHANLISQKANINTLELTNALGVASGGTGANSHTSGRLIVGNGTGAIQTIANVAPSITGGLSSSNTITSLTVDDYGRITAYTGASIQLSASQITSGTLGVARGGTGASTFTPGAILIGNDGNAIQELANSTFTPTGTAGGNNTISSITVDAYGRLTAVTHSAISGLEVSQGGTGRSSFTTNGILFGNAGDDLNVTAQAGDADQTWSNQILTVTNSGAPVWTTALDGGNF